MTVRVEKTDRRQYYLVWHNDQLIGAVHYDKGDPLWRFRVHRGRHPSRNNGWRYAPVPYTPGHHRIKYRTRQEAVARLVELATDGEAGLVE